MKRTSVNPWQWSLQFGFNQGELVEGHERVLFCASQTSIDGDGNMQHAGDIRAQITLAVDNLEAVLLEGGMTLANVVRLTIYTTEMGDMMKNFDVLFSRLEKAGVKPAQTMLGVAALAMRELMVEIEATAVG